jgi:hypothetical protein
MRKEKEPMPKHTSNDSSIDLNPALEKHLGAYALVATTALLSTAVPAQGKIVYTHANKIIRPNGHFNLDLNHDRVTDFTLSNQFQHSSQFQSGTLLLNDGAGPNGGIYHYSFAIPLSRGNPIGSQQKFLSGKNLRMARTSKSSEFTYSGGPFFDVKRKFLGLRFAIKGKVHYGWARVTVTSSGSGMTIKLLDYAYSTIPGQTIRAGQGIPHPEQKEMQSQTLGTLARGAANR